LILQPFFISVQQKLGLISNPSSKNAYKKRREQHKMHSPELSNCIQHSPITTTLTLVHSSMCVAYICTYIHKYINTHAHLYIFIYI